MLLVKNTFLHEHPERSPSQERRIRSCPGSIAGSPTSKDPEICLFEVGSEESPADPPAGEGSIAPPPLRLTEPRNSRRTKTWGTSLVRPADASPFTGSPPPPPAAPAVNVHQSAQYMVTPAKQPLPPQGVEAPTTQTTSAANVQPPGCPPGNKVVYRAATAAAVAAATAAARRAPQNVAISPAVGRDQVAGISHQQGTPWGPAAAPIHLPVLRLDPVLRKGATVTGQRTGPPPGSADLPSVGSAGHAYRQCKPCAFVYASGCENGALCNFCHLCEPGEKKRRQKERRAFRTAMKQLKHGSSRAQKKTSGP